MVKKRSKKSNEIKLVKNITRDVSLTPDLLRDIRELIESARDYAVRTVNSVQVLLYWDIGNRIHCEILKCKRAAYGKEIVPILSGQLEKEFGRGFSRQNLHRMVQIAQTFPDRQKVSTLSGQLGWSHFVELIPLGDDLKYRFYAEMCRIERWTVRTLRDKITGMLFERTAIAKNPQKVIDLELKKLEKTDQLSCDLVFRDPYILDFLQLPQAYCEKEFEAAIISEMEKFILELGAGFTFVERQKRMTVDNNDYYLDLLFYNRYLNRLVAIDLKLGQFQASDKGQMELYLRWLERYEMQRHEELPIGLILCAGKSEEHVELLQLSKTGIRVASYMTELPPKDLLEKTLKKAIKRAQRVMKSRSTGEVQE